MPVNGELGEKKVTAWNSTLQEGFMPIKNQFSLSHKFPNVNKELGPEMK